MLFEFLSRNCFLQAQQLRIIQSFLKHFAECEDCFKIFVEVLLFVICVFTLLTNLRAKSHLREYTGSQLEYDLRLYMLVHFMKTDLIFSHCYFLAGTQM